ncbi:MAG TPA: hypothetical protein PKH80_04690 [Methanofastidiosum sp.]|nr:hypothetical protein [Methanofastidiosum sp.]HNU60904.1 hypothetical protein [Methanofastidiosum sp.]
MNFFCDSGVPIAYAYPNDKFHINAKKHFQKFPFSSYKYFYSREVRMEFEKKRLERFSTTGRDVRTVRSIQKTTFDFFSRAAEKNFHDDKMFKNLEKAILDELVIKTGKSPRNLEKDSKIISNSILWSFRESPSNPTFLTVDYNDIIKNGEFILQLTSGVVGHKIILFFRGLFESK